jgi:N-acetylneuraminic acid mutarotase
MLAIKGKKPMKSGNFSARNPVVLCLVMSLVIFIVCSDARAQGTIFTYQGRLQQGTGQADGLYDIRCGVFNAASGGAMVGGLITNVVTVAQGLFTVPLDFGAGVFTGDPRWLELAVRLNGAGDNFTVLAPRQEINPTPYAMIAGGVPAASITADQLAPGSVGNVQLAPGAVKASNMVNGSVTSAQLAPGAAFTNLQQSGLSGVAEGGIVLSEIESNTNLANAGYIKIGKVDWIPGGWSTKASGPSTTGKPSLARASHSAVWTGSEMIIWGGNDGGYLNSGARYNPVSDSWSVISAVGAPAPRSRHTALWTGSQMLVWGGTAGGGRYNPATDTWLAMSLTGSPLPRYGHAAVWTGSLMLVWGGEYDTYNSPYFFDDGARYNPVANTWSSISAVGAPSERAFPAFVWTGSQLIIWGGGTSGAVFNNGARYNPVTDSWTPTATAGAPTPRSSVQAVWTGSQMIVWGGGTTMGLPRLGGIYNPSANSWSAMSTNNAPTGRYQHSVVWAGNKMIVWGGRDLNTGVFNDGGRYDPAADSWASIAASGAPAPRKQHTAVWTGSRMVVWGGEASNASDIYLDTGGRYNAANNTWSAVADSPATGEPGPRRDATAVWTGSEMIIWGGENNGLYLRSGGRFNPVANFWAQLPLANAPAGRIDHTAVWAGGRMLVWGGYNGDILGNGARYNPATDSWSAIATNNTPSPRRQHTAVSTGPEMIIWGGYAPNLARPSLASYAANGARYNPASDTWTSLSISNAPAGRAQHTAVWTGSEMIIWGGRHIAYGFPPVTTYPLAGGRYRPERDTWTSLPTEGAPIGRVGHTAIWTGRDLVVWGGGQDDVLITGGRYNLAQNSWFSLSTNNAPSARSGHTAVWTGWLMLVAGGDNGTTPVSNGGRYDPFVDVWSPLTASARTGHAAVWTGAEMIYWGGYSGANYLNDTATYTVGHTVYLYLKP